MCCRIVVQVQCRTKVFVSHLVEHFKIVLVVFVCELTMSEKRRKLSGSAYRKLASERREKETNPLKPIKSVDSFFKLAEKNQCEEGGCLIGNPGNSSNSSKNKNTEQY